MMYTNRRNRSSALVVVQIQVHLRDSHASKGKVNGHNSPSNSIMNPSSEFLHMHSTLYAYAYMGLHVRYYLFPFLYILLFYEMCLNI